MTSANLLVTALALLAVLLARRGLSSRAQGSDVARRLRTLYALIAALLLCRLISPMLGGSILTVATMAVASWLPLAALRLVEELTSRHADRKVKLLALGGAIGFTVVALSVGVLWSAGAIVALAVFQAIMLVLMAAQLVRARHDLSPADRQSAAAILAALLLSVPLVITDFRALFPDLDVRGGPFAVLLLVLASSTASIEARALSSFVSDVGLMLLAGAVAVIAAQAAGVAPSLALAGPIAGLAGLLLLIERFARAPVGPVGLAAALARSDAESRETLLAAHPLLASGRLLGSAELADYPSASLAALLRAPVTAAHSDDPDVRALARELLLAHGATHLIRLGTEPPALLAVAAGELASPALVDELALAGRLIERMP